MRNRFFFLLVIFITSTATAGERRFSAADAPAVRMAPGRIIIKNDSRSISAFKFFGNVREALFTLKATRRTIPLRPFGGAVYDSQAAVSAVPAHLSSAIQDAARQHGVDPRLVAAVARRESAFNVKAVSPVGACGVMQLMPSTARYLGVADVFDARQNIFGGARYLRTLLDTFNGDLDLTLAAYNAGPGAVAKYNGIPPYRETRAYVSKVRADYERSLRF